MLERQASEFVLNIDITEMGLTRVIAAISGLTAVTLVQSTLASPTLRTHRNAS